ncbi:MAG: argininosuccinate lyase, partial [Planctomycetes bacterium]|nr:argininosuccinate lyase [Planctomycetota bacterium]
DVFRLADHLVKKGVPFRQSHHIVSRLVRYAVDKERLLLSLRLEEFRKFSPLFGSDVYKVFNAMKSVESKKSYGGTSTKMVKKQIKIGKRILIHR